jgi:indolepyruvate ferredoxin oxidoreductase
MERALIVEYEKVVDEILAKLTPQNHATAVELASVPEHIRGYGHVKLAHLKTAKAREAALLAALRAPAAAPKPAVVKVVV